MNELSALQTSLAHGQAALHFHTGERGGNFRIFLLVLVAGAAGIFLCAATAHPGIALSLSILLGLLSLLFKLLDYRSRKLVHHAEALLRTAEARLAEETGMEECLLTARSEDSRDMSHTILYQASYTITIMLSVFVAIFAYSGLGS